MSTLDNRNDTLTVSKDELSPEKELSPPNEMNGDCVDLRQPYTAEEERRVVRKIDLVILPLVSIHLSLCMKILPLAKFSSRVGC